MTTRTLYEAPRWLAWIGCRRYRVEVEEQDRPPETLLRTDDRDEAWWLMLQGPPVPKPGWIVVLTHDRRELARVMTWYPEVIGSKAYYRSLHPIALPPGSRYGYLRLERPEGSGFESACDGDSGVEGCMHEFRIWGAAS